MQYTLIKTDEGTSVVTVFVPGHKPEVADSTHPNWDSIIDGILNEDDNVIDLFNIAQTAANKFRNLSERVSVANNRLYLDGDEVNDALAKQVVRFIDEGEDFMPLVNFFEKVQSNPNEHSRDQLYVWLQNHDFTITDSGDIVGYKGVLSDGNGGWVSSSSGKAMVNGEVKTGRIPNPIGAVVEMPRSEVHHDPSNGCSTGLHVATFSFARGFVSGGTVLEVHVNPRDVVSVPTDSNAEKVRCCRYKVVKVIDSPYSSALVDYSDTTGDYDEWGEYEDDDNCDCNYNNGIYCDGCEPEEEVKIIPPPSPAPPLVDHLGKARGQYGVNVGDKFEDKDSRRDDVFLGKRVVEVTGFGDRGSNQAVVRDNKGKTSKINIGRLLGRRFKKV